jgi:hypothetical protein
MSQREEVISLIKKGELTDDGMNVKLPPEFRKISIDGYARIIMNNEQGTIIGFWVYRGLHMGHYEMVVYTSFPEPPKKLEMGYIELYERVKLGENWYYISAY